VKILLLVNSSASSVTARGRVVIQKALSADHEVTLAETTRRGNATRLARGAAGSGTEVVVALGGDGTLNEAANGLAGTGCALAALPGGSTNVFARTLGLPNDPLEAAAVLLESLEQDAIRQVGLGSVNGRYFLFHTGLGFDAAVVRQVERRSALKRYAGHPLFVYAAFATWFRHYDRSRPRFALHLPDGTVVDDGYFALCLNTDPYTYLGNRPLHVAPDAGLDRPLSLVTLRSLRLPTLLGAAASALGVGGRMGSHRLVEEHRDLGYLRVTGHGPFPYQVDGDYLGEATELEIRHEPDVLRLVVPVPPRTP
jgi:diacylglycerol kinase family enzyme